MRIFCLKHELELEAESHSGSYYCEKCGRYPFIQETYTILEAGEILCYYPNGSTYITTLEELEAKKK